MIFVVQLYYSSLPVFILQSWYNREEKLLCHIAVVAKFFEWQQTENFTYKVNLHCFKLHWSCSIWFNFSNAGKIFWVESERTVYKFRKTKRKSLWCVHLLHKAGAWNIRKFHATVMQRWLKNVQKRMMNVMQLLFC